MSYTPDDLAILEAVAAAQVGAMWTCLPGYVGGVHTDLGHQYVDVIPAIKRPVRINGTLTYEELPTLPCVPVATLAGGGFHVSIPLKAGDPVTVVFSHLGIDLWLEKGDGKPMATGDWGTPGPSGAIALPLGPRTKPALLQDPDGASLIIGMDGGAPSLKLDTSGKLTITGDVQVEGGAEPAALGDTTQAALDTLAQACNDIISAIQGGIPGAMDGGAALLVSIIAQLAPITANLATIDTAVQSAKLTTD